MNSPIPLVWKMSVLNLLRSIDLSSWILILITVFSSVLVCLISHILKICFSTPPPPHTSAYHFVFRCLLCKKRGFLLQSRTWNQESTRYRLDDDLFKGSRLNNGQYDEKHLDNICFDLNLWLRNFPLHAPYLQGFLWFNLSKKKTHGHNLCTKTGY